MGRFLKSFVKGLFFGIFLALLFILSPLNTLSGEVEGAKTEDVEVITPTPEDTPSATPEVDLIITPTISPAPTLRPTPTSAPQPTNLPEPTPTAAPSPVNNDNNNEGGLLGLVNNYRQQKSLSILAESDSLCQYSQMRAGQIQSDFSHTQFQSDISSGVMFQTYCQGCKGVAENIAGGYKSENDTLNSWINSEGHRANLEGDYNLGCGSSAGNYYVFVFGRK